MNRRDFLKSSFILGSAVAAPLRPSAVAKFVPKKILVLGGTQFVGPALVDALLVSGHAITLFNRGVTNPQLFPHIEKLRGFRSSDSADQDFSALAHRRFDVVVDVWPNDPEIVSSAATFLKERAAHYLFVSSVGAYDHREFSKMSISEDAPLTPWNGSGRAYNRNKAESERRLHQIIGDKLTIVRPGPIAGHRDGGGDLLIWLLRAQDGGEHIAPGDGSDPVEFVDVKDVAGFLAMAINRSLYGTFNLSGSSMAFREFLEKCKAATNSGAEFVWIPRQFLHEHGLESNGVLHTFIGNFPYWEPDREYQGLYRVSSEKAYRAGWMTRGFNDTAFDCLEDFYSGEFNDALSPLSDASEQEVLEAWKRRAP
jgi:nucleoside-diphosphate-sugar epimerase